MFYLVRAKPKKELLKGLGDLIDSGKILAMPPFGEALQYSLQNARTDTEDQEYALWVEEDYCSPPLAMERKEVLDKYFTDITVRSVKSEDDAWKSLNENPMLWNNATKTQSLR